MTWDKVKKNDDSEEEDNKKFDDEDAKKWFKEGSKVTGSYLCVGLYGEDGTGKSGCCLDCMTNDEIEEGKKVVVIDLDNSCAELKGKYFEDNPNIIIFDPLDGSFDENGDPDDTIIYNKVKTFVKYIFENVGEENIHAVVFDGLDSLNGVSEGKMRKEDLKIDPNARLKNSWSWGIRNDYHNKVFKILKDMKCHRFFTTHYKDKYEFADGELRVVGKTVDWNKSVPGMLSQRIKMERRETEDDNVEFWAKVEKAKGALHLEGKEFLVARVTEDDTEWFGLSELWKQFTG